MDALKSFKLHRGDRSRPFSGPANRIASRRWSRDVVAVRSYGGKSAISAAARLPAVALAAVVVAFLGLRHHLGDWLQGRFFMATDFREISIRDIRKVKPAHDERPPVYFVETLIRLEPALVSDTPPPSGTTAAS